MENPPLHISREKRGQRTRPERRPVRIIQAQSPLRRWTGSELSIAPLGLWQVPDYEVVNATIVVNQAISHSRDFLPFDFGMFIAGLLWNLLGCFSDNLDTPDKSALLYFIGDKGFKGSLGRLRCQEVCLPQNIQEESSVDGRISDSRQDNAGLSFGE